jgi:DUF438 domain-containing protein
MTGTASSDILIGPRTTVYVLLAAYPSLDDFLLARDPAFSPLGLARARTRWARVTTLNDVAVAMNVSWMQLAREITAEIARATGRPARVTFAARETGAAAELVDELLSLAAALEAGGSLVELARRWEEVTDGIEPEEAVAIDRALVAAGAADGGADLEMLAAGAPPAGITAAVPEGHPLDTLRREAILIARLSADLESVLGRLGGSPTRRRWRRERPLVERLVERLGGIEVRFRRLRQAWFPALAVHGVDGPQSVLAQSQADALETLRRLRLAVARDDAASVAEGGARLVESLHELLAQDERLVEPLAERHFSRGDWAAVRELEDGVEWRLVAPPPAWPPA